jgi:hypothetical protein
MIIGVILLIGILFMVCLFVIFGMAIIMEDFTEDEKEECWRRLFLYEEYNKRK